MPLLAEGARRSGATLDDRVVIAQTIVVTGRDEQEMETAARSARGLLAFYASTPAYRPPLELEGWADVQPELNRLSKQQRWAEMPDVIDDGILAAFTLRAEPGGVGPAARARFGEAVDRVALSIPGAIDDAVLGDVLAGFR